VSLEVPSFMVPMWRIGAFRDIQSQTMPQVITRRSDARRKRGNAALVFASSALTTPRVSRELADSWLSVC
jgi:hypothetical protein